MGKLVSVVIPTHNRASLLGRAVRSALAQTYRNLEVLVIDDASTDDTEAVVRRDCVDDRVCYIRLPDNAGAGGARNAGVRAAKGDYVAFLDSDDEWLPQKIATQLAALQQHEAAAGVVCFSRFLFDWGQGRKLKPARGPSPGEPFSEYLFCHSGVAHMSTLVVSRAACQATPFVTELGEDTEFVLDLVARGARIVYVDEPLSVYYADGRPDQFSLSWSTGDLLGLRARLSPKISPRAVRGFAATVIAPTLLASRQPGDRKRGIMMILRAILAQGLSPGGALNLLVLMVLPKKLHLFLQLAKARRNGAEQIAPELPAVPRPQRDDRLNAEHPFVSVVIPCYNEGSRIDGLIAALRAQTYPKTRYEIIIADNRSGDDTVERVRRHAAVDPELYLVQEVGIQNADAARNLALNAAKGDVLAFTDGDCLPAPDWLRTGVAALRDADLAAGRIEFRCSSRPSAAELYDSIANLRHDLSVARRGVAFTANLFMHRDVFRTCGPFSVGCGGDFTLTSRATSSGYRLIYVKDAVVFHPARPFAALLKKAARIGREKALAPVPAVNIGPPPHVALLNPRRLRRELRWLSPVRRAAVFWCGVTYVAVGALSYAWHKPIRNKFPPITDAARG